MNGLEKSIIGALFRSPALLDTAKARNVTAETFASADARAIFAAFDTLATETASPDLVLFGERFPELALAAAEAFTDIPTTANFVPWIERAKDLEARRALVSACQQTIRDTENPEKATKAIFGALEGDIETARVTSGGRHCPDIQEAARALAADLTAGPQQTIPLFPSNTEAAQKVTMHPGELWIIGAQTGGGKTALAAGMVCDMLKAGLNIVYFCVETSTEEILRRIAAAWCSVPHWTRDQRGRLAIAEAAAEIAQKKIHIFGNDGGAITPGTIRRTLRAIESKDGPAAAVIVDFIQGMKPDRRGRTALEEINSIVLDLHDILLESRAAGLVLAQFNRQAQTGGGLPNMTWLKDTSTLEQLAHTVAFLHW